VNSASSSRPDPLERSDRSKVPLLPGQSETTRQRPRPYRQFDGSSSLLGRDVCEDCIDRLVGLEVTPVANVSLPREDRHRDGSERRDQDGGAVDEPRLRVKTASGTTGRVKMQNVCRVPGGSAVSRADRSKWRGWRLTRDAETPGGEPKSCPARHPDDRAPDIRVWDPFSFIVEYGLPAPGGQQRTERAREGRADQM
jgi:hypothetical protein